MTTWSKEGKKNESCTTGLIRLIRIWVASWTWEYSLSGCHLKKDYLHFVYGGWQVCHLWLDCLALAMGRSYCTELQFSRLPISQAEKHLLSLLFQCPETLLSGGGVGGTKEGGRERYTRRKSEK